MSQAILRSIAQRGWRGLRNSTPSHVRAILPLSIPLRRPFYGTYGSFAEDHLGPVYPMAMQDRAPIDEYSWMHEGRMNQDMDTVARMESDWAYKVIEPVKYLHARVRDAHDRHASVMPPSYRVLLRTEEWEYVEVPYQLAGEKTEKWPPSGLGICRRHVPSGDIELIVDDNTLPTPGPTLSNILAIDVTASDSHMMLVAADEQYGNVAMVFNIDPNAPDSVQYFPCCTAFFVGDGAGGDVSVLYTLPRPDGSAFQVQVAHVYSRGEGDQEIQPTVVYTEHDSATSVDVAKSTDAGHVIITSTGPSGMTARVFAVSGAGEPAAVSALTPPTHLEARPYQVDHWCHEYLMAVSDPQHNIKVMSVPDDAPESSEWSELALGVPPPHYIMDLVPVDTNLVIVTKDQDFQYHLFISQYGNVEVGEEPEVVEVPLPPHISTIALAAPYSPAVNSVIVSITGPMQTPTSYELSVPDGALDIASFVSDFEAQAQRERPGQGDTDPAFQILGDASFPSHHDFVIEEAIVPFLDAKDDPGTVDFPGVPLVTVRARHEAVDPDPEGNDLNPHDASRPCLLSAHGAFGDVRCLEYTPMLHALLDRGWVLAHAGVRGGGEWGVGWHEAGRFQDKFHSIDDYLACAEYLHAHQDCDPRALAARASSIGAVTVATAINHQPDLFRAAIFTSALFEPTPWHYERNSPLMQLLSQELGDWRDRTDSDIPFDKFTPYGTLSRRPRAQFNGYARDLHPEGMPLYPDVWCRLAADDDMVPPWNTYKFVTGVRDQFRDNHRADDVEREPVVACRSEPRGGHDIEELPVESILFLIRSIRAAYAAE